MHEQVTLLGPQATPGETPRPSALPRDLLEQVRGRVRLLAALLLIGFVLDPAIFAIGWTIGTLSGVPVRFGNAGFVLMDAAVALGSLGVWWLAGQGRVDRAAGAAPGLTAENAVQGTPAFIAPEQALGDANVDGRADIYATGCVAYWLLTGQHVFTADTPMGILIHHARTPPVPPSERIGQPIPPGLEALIMECLAKDPADRPQTARVLSLRLGEAQCGETWNEDRARESWATHHTV